MGQLCGSIVLTGGPSGGKSQSITKIKEVLETRGYHVILVDEGATRYMNMGLFPFPKEAKGLGMIPFQYALVPYKIWLENHLKKITRDEFFSPKERKYVILYDRAIMDDKNYISDEDFTKLAYALGFTEEEFLNGYDLILHLESLSSSNNLNYDMKDGNATRYENADEAARLDRRVNEIYSKHPNYKFIRCEENFNKKTQKSIDYVLDYLGEKHVQTINKYSIDLNKSSLKVVEGINPEIITRTYLDKIDPKTRKTIYERNEFGNSIYQLKKETDLHDDVMKEYEHISKNIYNTMLDMHRCMSQNGTEKFNRYYFNGENHFYKLDEFIDGRGILRIESLDERSIILPEGLEVVSHEKTLRLR